MISACTNTQPPSVDIWTPYSLCRLGAMHSVLSQCQYYNNSILSRPNPAVNLLRKFPRIECDNASKRPFSTINLDTATVHPVAMHTSYPPCDNAK